MSADSAVLSERDSGAMKLDFELPLADYADIAQQVAWPWGKRPGLKAACGVLLAAQAAFSAGLHFSSTGPHHSWQNWLFGFTTLFQILFGWNIAANNALTRWLSRKSMRGVSDTRLELDSSGIRGTIETLSPFNRKGREAKHYNYGWRRIRDIHRPAGFILLEFHGGGTITIPEKAFASRHDKLRCLEWAERGLAEQQKQRSSRSTAA